MLFSDNKSTITLSEDHACTKHIDVHFHFICWIIDDGQGMARVSKTHAGRGYGYMRVRVRVEILLPASFKTNLCLSQTVKY